MERKYYLRGLGLGIAVTAVIMGIALSGERSMTNEEIIARAKELGLVENTILSDAGSAESEQENVTDGEEQDVVEQPHDIARTEQDDLDSAEINPGVEDDETEDPATDVEDHSDEIEQKNDTDTDDFEREDDDETNPVPVFDTGGEVQDDITDLTADDAEVGDDNGTFTPVTIKVITINSGDSSYTVAKKLENAGVVSSASNFDTFLCQNGYDKRLRTGNFSIPTDASDEQIARIVTGLE